MVRGASFGAALLCLAGGWAGLASGQGITDPKYRINAGDIIRIEVTGRADLSATITVDDQGSLTLPTIGLIRAAGRTPSELGADITRRISMIQRESPQVRVIVMESRSQKIFVLGAVLLPGAYSFAKDPTVWEAISEAGGATAAADLSTVEIVSSGLGPGAAPQIVDLATAIRMNTYETLPRLKPGDTVRVPSTSAVTVAEGNIVYLMGAVGAQGPRPLEAPGDLITTLIRSAPSGEADLSRIEIVRRTGGRLIQMNVDARGYLSDAQVAGNPILEPGDAVYVPRQRQRFGIFSVLGYISPILGLITTVTVLTR
ncbi:MAG TPA: polysaccharide biosynthesis/export family protein [Candidatus Eisenbacteria bacterium]|nr:polysaccharide biosynthesis/export family protein [Candidatus Eisenbacteria bacterium]